MLFILDTGQMFHMGPLQYKYTIVQTPGKDPGYEGL